MSTAVTTAVLSASNHPGRGTIADAIGASDREAMLAAATTAAAHAFISELPEGYDTPVGDGGVILSPSQRLRLSVARILATDPPALLLDDPTAYLDAASEAAVLPGLEAVFRGRNVVILDASPAVTAAARAAAEAHGTTVEVTRESWSPEVAFDPGLRTRLRALLGDVPELPTGAGHDAGVLAAHVPTARLFVRNPTGVSHSPAEHAEPDDCVAGIRALASVLEDLACR